MYGRSYTPLAPQELPEILKAGMERRKRMRELTQRIAELRSRSSIPERELKQIEAEHDKLKTKGKKLTKHKAI